MCSHTSERNQCERIETEDNNAEIIKHWSTLSTVGFPLINDTIPSTIINRICYTVSYNPTTRQPNWVMWQLTDKHVMKKKEGVLCVFSFYFTLDYKNVLKELFK